MYDIRRSEDRGHENYGWLDTRHTFSFGNYFDPRFMGFRSLLVINEDRVKAGAGFPTHPHRDMEIISYVLEGALEHQDSMGNGSVIRRGEVQRMSAGTGVTHSEYNASKTEATHFLQIWIQPNEKNLSPSYEQKRFALAQNRGKLQALASRDGREGSVTIHQDAMMFGAMLDAGQRTTYELSPERCSYVHVARGEVQLFRETLKAGDGMAIIEETSALDIASRGDAEFLVFDLA